MNFWNVMSGLLAPWSKRKPASVVIEPDGGWHDVMASSFADPADVDAFRKAKAKGMTDREAFQFGDNGIGCWGDDTTGPQPMVALPPEDWRHLGVHARGAAVLVRVGNRMIRAELRDTMPKRANIKNGAGIDLNPAACEALGLHPPVMTQARWKFG